MRSRILLFLILIVVALTLILTSEPSRAASPPSTISPAGVTSRYDAGWMHVTCTARDTSHGRDTDQRCHLRVPSGFSSMAVSYVHGGDLMAVDTSYPYHYRPLTGRHRFDQRIERDVRVACSARGGRIACEVRFRERVSRFAVTVWSAGNNYGGMRWTRM